MPKDGLSKFPMVLVVAFLGCGGVAGPLSFSVDPQTIELLIGESETITVSIRDANGVQITGQDITFRSANAQIATVSAAGVVEGLNPGTTTIDLISDGVTGQIAVSVSELSIVLNVLSTQIPAGRAVSMAATTVNSLGNPLPQEVIWSSEDASIATITTRGLVEGIREGNTSIMVSAAGMRSDSVISITITPPIASTTGDWLALVPLGGFQVAMELRLIEQKTGVIGGGGDFGGIPVSVEDGMNSLAGSVSMSITAQGFFPIRVSGSISADDPNLLNVIFNESDFDNVPVTFTKQ